MVNGLIASASSIGRLHPSWPARLRPRRAFLRLRNGWPAVADERPTLRHRGPSGNQKVPRRNRRDTAAPNSLCSTRSNLPKIHTAVSLHDYESPVRGDQQFTRHYGAVLLQARHLVAREPLPLLHPLRDRFHFDGRKRRVR